MFNILIPIIFIGLLAPLPADAFETKEKYFSKTKAYVFVPSEIENFKFEYNAGWAGASSYDVKDKRRHRRLHDDARYVMPMSGNFRGAPEHMGEVWLDELDHSILKLKNIDRAATTWGFTAPLGPDGFFTSNYDTIWNTELASRGESRIGDFNKVYNKPDEEIQDDFFGGDYEWKKLPSEKPLTSVEYVIPHQDSGVVKFATRMPTRTFLWTKDGYLYPEKKYWYPGVWTTINFDTGRVSVKLRSGATINDKVVYKTRLSRLAIGYSGGRKYYYVTTAIGMDNTGWMHYFFAPRRITRPQDVFTTDSSNQFRMGSNSNSDLFQDGYVPEDHLAADAERALMLSVTADDQYEVGVLTIKTFSD